MIKINIKETNLKSNSYLNERTITDMIVIHHTGERDIDASAAEIDQWHKNQGWTMIGYHFVIRKNGTIERGRPEYTIGSHAYGENWHTLGIHLSGDFEKAKPTDQQVEMCAMLIAYLCDKYNIPTDKNHIVGHCDLMSTDCPGKFLYSQLKTIIGKANWYRYQSTPDAVIKEVITIQSNSPIDENIKLKIKALLDYAEVLFVT
ncbi:MAG: N-acetylmuramoyl-L-alanine amidase [Selenomonadaceae bacterium]|nr:N-acetylmuramoyl-L-alanine amidase [Selenomonadaceae bacterium]MBR1730706.1 N-acetylmuramoyl-L-alanine amidase [Selenomonadaceae bacterium]